MTSILDPGLFHHANPAHTWTELSGPQGPSEFPSWLENETHL